MSRLNLRIDTVAMQTTWGVLLLAVSASGANRTVMSGGGGNFTTIQACANAMAAGDTCTVYAGTYNENVTVPAGTAGNYKTMSVNGSDVVTVQSFTLDSHTKLIGNCPMSAAINTCGFNIQNPSSPSSNTCVGIPNGATDIYIKGNVMYACGTSAMVGLSSASQGLSYIYIQGNTLSYACVASGVQVNTTSSFSSGVNSIVVGSVGGAQNGWVVYGNGLNVSNGVRISSISGTTLNLTPVTGGNATITSETNTPVSLSPPECNGILLAGDHFLVENNDLSHYTLGINFGNGSYGIYRNNILHDVSQAEAGGNSHTDAFYDSPSTTTSNHVIEGNNQYNGTGPDAKGLLTQGQYSPCNGTCGNVVIFRFNTVNNLGSGNLSGYGYNYVKLYNNTYVNLANLCSSCAGGIDNFFQNTYAMKNWADLNNLFYFGSAVTNIGPANPVASDSASAATGSWGHNLASCNAIGSSNCSLFGHLYESGSWTGDTGNILGFQNQVPTNNPNFVNLSGNDFHLQSGSPALAAGTYLTTVASGDSGSGTSLVVSDATYFQDGYGLSNAYSTVNADCIAVGTTASHVCITGVDYSTNTLTLASSITRSPGNPVWLYSKSDGTIVLTGSGPNIGAYGLESGSSSSSPTAPTLLTAVSQ